MCDASGITKTFFGWCTRQSIRQGYLLTKIPFNFEKGTREIEKRREIESHENLYIEINLNKALRFTFKINYRGDQYELNVFFVRSKKRERKDFLFFCSYFLSIFINEYFKFSYIKTVFFFKKNRRVKSWFSFFFLSPLKMLKRIEVRNRHVKYSN